HSPALQRQSHTLARLFKSSPQTDGNVSSGAKAAAQEIAAAIGARDITAFEVDQESVVPLYESGHVETPAAADLRAIVSTAGQAFVQADGTTIVPVTGLTGELCAALSVVGEDVVLGETERRLLSGFAH